MRIYTLVKCFLFISMSCKTSINSQSHSNELIKINRYQPIYFIDNVPKELKNESIVILPFRYNTVDYDYNYHNRNHYLDTLEEILENNSGKAVNFKLYCFEIKNSEYNTGFSKHLIGIFESSWKRNYNHKETDVKFIAMGDSIRIFTDYYSDTNYVNNSRIEIELINNR